ncbi:MAG: hypothetical protein QM831_18095 [Kofleriaceae bacterium]
MKRLLLVLLIGCSKKEEHAAPKQELRPLPVEEIKRAQDACDAYVAKICACPSEAAKDQCKLAHAYPEALKLAGDVAANPESTQDSAARAQVNIRETSKQCIELMGKLGQCPQ